MFFSTRFCFVVRGEQQEGCGRRFGLGSVTVTAGMQEESLCRRLRQKLVPFVSDRSSLLEGEMVEYLERNVGIAVEVASVQ